MSDFLMWYPVFFMWHSDFLMWYPDFLMCISSRPAIHNHINLTRSLTYKHQDLQLFYLRPPFYFTQNIFGNHEIISFDNYNIIKEFTGLDNLQFYKWVEFYNV